MVRRFADPNLAGKTLEEALDYQRGLTGKRTPIGEWLRVSHLRPSALRDLSAEQVARVERQRLIEIQKAAQETSYRTKQITNVSQVINSLWARAIGSSAISGNLTTHDILLRTLAKTQTYVNKELGRQYKQFALHYKYADERLKQYQAAVEWLGKTGFTLWVSDTGVLPKGMETPTRMLRFNRELAKKASEIIYDALEEALTDAIAKVASDKRAWPSAYTALLARRLQHIRSRNMIELYGHSVSGWRLAVDFQQLFGDPGYLQSAEHYGALTGSRASFDSSIKIRNGGRVTALPYRGQTLANSPSKRYQFWLAMASGRKVFYGGQRTRQEATKARDYWPDANKKDQMRLRKMQKAYDKSSTHDPGALRDELNKKEALKYRIDELDEKVKFRKANVKKRASGIKIPDSAWEDTIAARCAYWSKLDGGKGLAPVWWYLEFGQLRWAPTIAPQGLTYRFLLIARERIQQLVKEEFDRELSNTGARLTPGGRLVSTGTPIRYGPQKGQTLPKGRSLNTGLLAALNAPIQEANRNAEEAASVAGIFVAPEQPIGQWGDTSHGVQLRFWMDNDFERPRRTFSGSSFIRKDVSQLTPSRVKYTAKGTFGRAVTLAGGRSRFNALSSTERGALFRRARDPSTPVFKPSWKKRRTKKVTKIYKVNNVPEGVTDRSAAAREAAKKKKIRSKKK